MSNLVLTRKADQSIQFTYLNGDIDYLQVLNVGASYCKFRRTSNLQVEQVQLKDTYTFSEGVKVQVVSIGRGQVKLNITAPRDVHILRSELLKDY